MKIDIEAYEQAANEGSLVHDWSHCMMAVAAGADSIEGCVTEGWPRWLAEYGVQYFDRFSDKRDAERGDRFLKAVKAVNSAGDWDRVFRDWRLDSILPIAMESVGEGDEPWRVECREIVQWSIDNGGAAADAARADGAILAAKAARAAGADGAIRAALAPLAAVTALAAGANWAAVAVGTARAAEATKVARAAEEAARDRIEESFFRVLEKAALQEDKQG